MDQSVPNAKCLVFCLLSLALGAVPALGGAPAKASKPTGAEAYARRVTATKNRLALEAYEKRNAQITPRAQDAVPTITDNAALLYYQACLFVPKPNSAIRDEIRATANARPSKEIRTYLGHCLPVIEMVETASRIPGCTWAVWPEGGPGWDPLSLKLGLICDVLLMDARTLAVDGHYPVALERCLTVRRFARHLSDDPELYLSKFGGAADAKALYMMLHLLGMIPPDANVLTWFRSQLASVPGLRMSFAETLRAKVKVQLDGMRTYPDHLRARKEMAAREAEGQQAKENILSLTDEQFLSRAREGLAQFTDSIIRIVDSEATYEEKLSHIHGLGNETMEDNAADPVVKGFISPSGMNMKVIIARSYSFQVEHEARVNGTKAAVEVYLALAKNGELPEKLPGYLPKDPFTGQDFGYEITHEGFALRCQGEEFLRRKKHLLEFKVRKSRN